MTHSPSSSLPPTPPSRPSLVELVFEMAHSHTTLLTLLFFPAEKYFYFPIGKAILCLAVVVLGHVFVSGFRIFSCFIPVLFCT